MPYEHEESPSSCVIRRFDETMNEIRKVVLNEVTQAQKDQYDIFFFCKWILVLDLYACLSQNACDSQETRKMSFGGG